MTTRVRITHGCSSDANTWIVFTPDDDKYAETFSDYSKMRAPPIGESETLEIGSGEFSRCWTLTELSELVREGRNLALGAGTSMGLTYDRDPTMMCDLSGRLFNVLPITLGERVKRRIVRKLPMWRPAPANPPTPSRDLTTHVGPSLERSAPRQRTPRVRSDRVISVSDHVWVSMETDRIDRLKFVSVVALPDDASVREARGLMPLPGGGNVAVQRIPSSDLAMFVDRAVDGMLPSPGDLWNIRDETFLRAETKVVTRPTCVIACPFNLRLMKPGNLQMICGPSGSNMITKLGGISLARQLLRSTRIGL